MKTKYVRHGKKVKPISKCLTANARLTEDLEKLEIMPARRLVVNPADTQNENFLMIRVPSKHADVFLDLLHGMVTDVEHLDFTQEEQETVLWVKKFLEEQKRCEHGKI